jgi:hypothetical protein
VTTVAEVAGLEYEIEAVLRPWDRWKYQCHAASLHIVRKRRVDGARVARGSCRGVPGQHSWVVVGDPYDPTAPILDATLWSYTETWPDLWIGSMESHGLHRPHGMGSLFEWGKPPTSKSRKATIRLRSKAGMSPEAKMLLSAIEPLDAHGWIRLLSAPVFGVGGTAPYMAEILAAADDTPALSPLIPIDVLGMVTDRNPDGLYMASDDEPGAQLRMTARRLVMVEAATVIRCPTDPLMPSGEEHTIVGCGSENVEGPDEEGLFDCLDCGIWFDPKREREET